MAPSQADRKSADATPEEPRVGPHPSYVEIAKPYIFEPTIRECLSGAGVSEAKDDNIRLQGIAWIDSVRKAMHLPVRTYNTAAVYYHKFRLVNPETNGYIDAAAAALFAACKIEDTLKKSREILCAAHNLKISPSDHSTPDDFIFETHSKTIIGLERLMLEASGFDFRNRYPQKLVVKIAKTYDVDRDTVGRTAYNLSLDLYRTFAPLKQTTQTMAVACVELAGRICEQRILDLESGKHFEMWHIKRGEVMETLLDLLDLYTNHRAVTLVGQSYPLESFISIRIALNQEASADKIPRHTLTKPKRVGNGVKKMNGTDQYRPKKILSPKSPLEHKPSNATSPVTNGHMTSKSSGLKDGTVRFMLSAERAKEEKEFVAEFFTMEEEEYEVDVPMEKHRRRV